MQTLLTDQLQIMTPSPPRLLLPLLLLLLSQIPPIAPLPEPYPAAIQPSLILPTAAPPSTIPAFPEQSAAAAGAVCPLELSDDLLAGISAACSPRRGSRQAYSSHCCPALAAGLFSAYAATALSAGAATRGGGGHELPVLPDDSESCAGAAEREIAAHGVDLPRLNATCGAVRCYCGIRLRRFSCSAAGGGGGGVSVKGRWEPRAELAREMQKSCARQGIAGCSRCLRTLSQLKGTAAGNGTTKGGKGRGDDCQLMGLTWLLSKNRTLFLPTATSVLGAIMAAEAAGDDVASTTCSLAGDAMPLAVGSTEIDGEPSAASAFPPSMPPLSVLQTFVFLLIGFYLVQLNSRT